MSIVFISADEVIAFHRRIMQQTPGLIGKIDRGKIEAMILRVQNLYYYENITDLHLLAAAYLLAVARGHSFVDGNKRAAFFVTVAFLRRNGIILSSSLALVDIVVEAAAGKIVLTDLAEILKEYTV